MGATVANTDLVIATATVLVAGLMRGFAGFGSGMLMAPIFAVLFGPIDAVAMVTVLEFVASVQLLPQALKHTEWRFVMPLGLAAAILMPAGAHLLRSADPALLTKVMAVVVLGFVIVLMAGWRYQGEKRLLSTLGVGAVSGALMAATSMGNPPVLIYMLAGQDSAARNRANITAYFAVTQVVLLALLTSMAMLALPVVVRAAVLTPVYLMAAWIGSRLFHHSNEALYRRTAILILLGVGLFSLFR
jgi:uncharacterized membrane protein YfcA